MACCKYENKPLNLEKKKQIANNLDCFVLQAKAVKCLTSTLCVFDTHEINKSIAKGLSWKQTERVREMKMSNQKDDKIGWSRKTEMNAISFM